MSARARIFLRQNVIGLVALFVALSGTALALPGKNTVDSGDIKPANVKSSDIAPDSVDGSKVLDESLTGSDVSESSLGQVPSAASAAQATTAATAITATNAGNASTLDGRDSDFFLNQNSEAGGDLAGHFPSPFIRNDAVDDETVKDNSLEAEDISHVEALAAFAAAPCNDSTPGAGGPVACASLPLNPTPFSVIYTCEDTGPNRIAQVLIQDDKSGDIWALDSDGPNGATDQTAIPAATGPADRRVLASAGPTPAAHFQGGDYIALSSSGHVLTGEVAVGTNVFGADCAAAFSFVG